MSLLDGKVAIITGAGRGLGEAYARLLAENGAAVVINDICMDDNGVYLASQVADAIVSSGGRAVAHTDDIATVEGGKSILQAALDAFEGAHILINNAGILRDKSFLKLSEEDWDDVMRVNIKSMFTVTQPVFAWMKANGGGVIVNTSSTSGLIGNFGQLNYGAAKAAVLGLSNVLAIEGAKSGIRVWTLAPAATSALTAPLMTDEQKAMLSPEHVAQTMLYMVSELSGDRTGHCLFASGQRIRELKLTCAEGILGSGIDGAVDAHEIARRESEVFCKEPLLSLQAVVQ